MLVMLLPCYQSCQNTLCISKLCGSLKLHSTAMERQEKHGLTIWNDSSYKQQLRPCHLPIWQACLVPAQSLPVAAAAAVAASSWL